MKKIVILVVAILFCNIYVFGQLTGTKTIKTSGGDYSSIATAITDLNTNGVGSGGVTFNIDSNFTESLSAPIIITATGTSSNPIVFQKSGTGANPKITADTGVGTTDGIITLAGSDYIAFDGIDLEENSSNTTIVTRMEWGFGLLKASADSSGCQYVTIKNCTISLNQTNTNASGKGAIYLYNALASTPGTTLTINRASQTNSYNNFYNNTLQNTYNGFYIYGYAAASPYSLYDQNNYIGVNGGNNITNYGYTSTSYGVYAIYQNNIKVNNNNIQNKSGSTSTLYGIFLSTGNSSNAEIYKNYVSLYVQSTSSTAYAINNAMGSTPSSNTVKIHHNTVRKSKIALSTSSSTFYGIYNTGGADKVYIKNNIVDSLHSPGTGSIYGIYNSASGVNLLELDSNIVDSISKTNTGTLYLIYTASTATNSYAYVFDNSISRVYTTSTNTIYGFYNTNSATGVRKYTFRNKVENIVTGGTTVYAIYQSSGDSIWIYRNSASNISSTSTAAPTLYGLYVSSGTNVFAYNNMLSDIRAETASNATAVYGMYLSSPTNAYVYYNSIYLDAYSSGTNFGSIGLYAGTAVNLDLKNNIIVNNSTANGTGVIIAYRRSSTTLNTHSTLSNNNCFYAGTPGSKYVIFYDGTNYDSTLTQFQTRLNGPENLSFSENPPFTNVGTIPYDLHMPSASSTLCEAAATPITTPIIINQDFDGQTRNSSYPDVGADEGSFLDVKGPSIQYTPLTNTTSTTNRTLTTTIFDANGVPTSGAGLPKLYSKKNYNGSYTGVTATYIGANQYSFTFGAGSAMDTIFYYIAAQDIYSTPNVSTAPSGGSAGYGINPPSAAVHPTSPSFYKILGTLAAGLYKIGGSGTTPAAGCSYVDLTAAMKDLSNKELQGAITLVLTNKYNHAEEDAFPIVLNTVIGSSSSNTVTIKPDSNHSDTISVNTTAIFKFNGADYFIIDGSNNNSTSRNLTLENTATTGTTTVVWFSSLGTNAGCMNNTVKNCILRNGSKTVTTMSGISIGGAIGAAGNDNDNITITNNVIQKSYYGVYQNAAAVGLANNLTIKNNVMTDTGAMALGKYGIYALYARNAKIEGNTIKNLVGTITNPTAIYFGTGVDSSSIIANTINTINYTGTGGYGGKGIDVTISNANGNILIANNNISDLFGDGWSTFTSDAIVGIRIHGTTGGIKIYNNSVNLTGNISRSGATADLSAALYIGATSSVMDIRNNILVNSLDNTTGVAKAYAIYSAIANTAFTNINYNDYFVTGAEGVLAYLAADVTTLSAWKTATAQDANSLDINPSFASSSDLHYTVASLVNKGTPISAVTTDIEGNSRSTTNPDMGCFEFVLKPKAITGTKSSVTSSGATIYGQVNANDDGTSNITFGYGLTTSYDSTITGNPATATGTSNTSSSASITGLLPNSLYHYRVAGANGGGSTYGVDSTFTTTAIVAEVTTDSSNNVKADSAKLFGSVKANNASTTVVFEYGKTIAYGSSVAATPSPVTGMNKTSVNIMLGGLDPNTTYHFRVKGTNAAGSAYGADDSFTTLKLPPTAATLAASSVTTTSAQLNGNVNAKNTSTNVTFEWGTTTAYGNTVNATQSPVTGLSTTAMSYNLSGLVPNTKYHFRIIAMNSAGTTYGNDDSFTTPVILPDAKTLAATNVSADSAELNGWVNANNSATAVAFEFGLNTTYGMIIPAIPANLNGLNNTAVTAKMIGLLPNTTYHYRVVAANAKGTTYGNDTFFTTPVILPAATTDAASMITVSAATLNGSVDPNNDTTTVSFEYGLTSAYGYSVSAFQSPLTGMGSQGVTYDLIGLDPNTSYHFRVVATNMAGTVYGNDMFFTTSIIPPTVITKAATDITFDSATLNGEVNANNDTTYTYFEYGTTTAYGTFVSAVPGMATGLNLTPVSYILSGLTPNTLYHYRIYAINQHADTVWGADSSFTTTAKLAMATVDAATTITTNTAKLNGEVTANNTSTAITFEFGLTTAYGQTFTANPDTIDGLVPTAVSFNVSGLSHSTTYHYRVVAVNAAGTVTSADTFFTTADTLPIVTTDAATAVTKSSAVSGGNVTNDGGSAITARGVCWSKSPNPDVTMTKTTDGTGTGTFTSNITGLDPNTLYYVRAYAENALGVSYGNEISFSTSPNSILEDGLAGKIKVYSADKVAYIQIDSKENINGHIQIFDLNGNRLTETRIADNSTQFDLSAYAQATYLVSVIVDGKVYSTKIFVR